MALPTLLGGTVTTTAALEMRDLRGSTDKDIVRLESKIQAEPNTGCWLWTGAVTHDGYGYGVFRMSRPRRNVAAHRAVWELHRGPVPDGLTLDHLCRVRCCVNPDHLEAVAHRVNCLRGISPAALHAKKTSCPHGHAYDTSNTIIRKDGSRRCRSCTKIRDRRRWPKRYARYRAAS